MRLFHRKFLALTAAIAVGATSAFGFSVIGPFDGFQVPAIGYNPRGVDQGAPMNLGEEYRWNMRSITYGFDPSFLNYFGQKGVQEVNKAIAILNNLPAMSSMSSNLTEFSTDTRRINFEASALALFDLKSVALSVLVQDLGLTSPERYVWCLRDRRPVAGDPANFVYLVIKRNFDPVTWAPSSFVNGVLYTYFIDDPIPVVGGTPYADAWEMTVDPLQIGYTAVVSAVDPAYAGKGALVAGEFFVGLTRDDVGGLRYLYAGKGRRTNLNIENLVVGTTGGSSVPWGPIATTNALVDLALRPGVDKFVFKQVKYDSDFGFFLTVTNFSSDRYVTNRNTITQTTQRILTTPDIVFTADDIIDGTGNPVLTSHGITFINNSALNGQGGTGGPGIINPPLTIIFNKIGPFIQNQSPNSLDEVNSFPGFVWGSFDGRTNAPFVYPIGSTIQDLVQQVLGGN